MSSGRGKRLWLGAVAALGAGALLGITLVQAHTVKHDSTVGLFTTSTIDDVLQVIGSADSLNEDCWPKREMQLVRNRGDKVMKEDKTRNDGIVVVKFRDRLREAKYHWHLKKRDIGPNGHKHICTGDDSESQELHFPG